MKLEYISDSEIEIRDFIKNNISRKFKRSLKALNPKYFINDIEAYNYSKMNKGDRLTIIYDDKSSSDKNYYDIDIDVVYETENYMIINKPRGLKSIPTGYNNFESLYNAILSYYKKNNIVGTVHLINRLDKDTEGLLLVCKNKISASIMSKNLDNINRWYLALVSGVLEGEGVISKPIKRAEGIKREVSLDGKESTTTYEALNNDGKNTLVRLHLLSGRCHQIRVHMSSIGHPVVGDALYGEGCDLHLTSYKIELTDPYTNEKIVKEIKPTWLE